MAIDLGSNSSPYEFENMLPLDVLAAVASETLRNEIHSNDNSEKKISSYFKKQVKKSNLAVMTFEDIKSLPIKSLVEKFSELTSDELTKKYFYKCLLIPHRCIMTFKSFGNEKKASDKIKSHLLSHVQQLSAEYDANKEIFTTVFTPKSPTSSSKQQEKLSKKSKKHVFLSRPELCHKMQKTSKKKNAVYSLKKMKKKFQHLNKKSLSEFKKCLKDKKLFNSVYLKEKSSSKKNGFKGLSYKSLEENILSLKIKEEILEDSDVESDRERYNSYSEHLKSTFLSDAFLDEDNEPLIYSEEVPTLSNVDNEDNISRQTDVIESRDKCLIFLQDHNYAMMDVGSKCDKLLTQELKHLSRRNITCFTHQPIVQPQLIIRTPPFPFVHTPLLPEVAEIKEIGVQEMCDSTRLDHSNCFDYLCDESKLKYEVELPSDEQLSEPEEKYAASIFYKMTGASGSVLECVENIVSNKYSSSCLPKSEIPANENDENLENLQRIEKELALKYIAKLHAKKKKRIPDSLICQICPDKHFTAQATLIHHYRSHAGIKPYVCKICSATFTRQHSLNYHMLIHQNLSRFTCEFCGRTFRHPSHYKEHLRRHTGETPYHCTDCNLHFKTRNTFKRHLKTRHGKLLTASGIEDLSVEDYAKFNPKSKFGK